MQTVKELRVYFPKYEVILREKENKVDSIILDLTSCSEPLIHVDFSTGQRTTYCYLPFVLSDVEISSQQDNSAISPKQDNSSK